MLHFGMVTGTCYKYCQCGLTSRENKLNGERVGTVSSHWLTFSGLFKACQRTGAFINKIWII